MKQEKLVKIRRLNIKNEDANHTFVMEPIDKKVIDNLKKESENTDNKELQQKYSDVVKANNQYRKSKIFTRESEIIRIVTAINNENASLDGGYPFVKDLVVVNFGKSAKQYGELLQRENPKDNGIIAIRNVLNDDGVRYKNLLCSSSHVRTSKAMFIREGIFNKVNQILLCGIPKNYKFKVFAKYNSYYGLVSTDSIPVSMPNIVVIPDYINNIEEVFDVVKGDVGKAITAKFGKKHKEKVIGHGQYEVINDQRLSYKIMPFDGAGLVDVSRMQIWANELSLDYIPAAVQFRAIPGIKGNLYTFDLKAYAAQLKAEGKPTIIIDYWGKVWDFEKDQIDCIMTKSQFKFADIYKDLAIKAKKPEDGFKVWHDEFIKPVKIAKGKFYQRTFNLSEISEPYCKLEDKCMLSYQPLQTLEFTPSEIRHLCEETVNLVEKVHTDIDEFMKYRGLFDDEHKNHNKVLPFYKALKANPILYYDTYIRKQIKNDLKSLRYRCYTGKLLSDGNYQVFTPDVLGLAEAAFGQSVIGGLGAGQIYSKYWCDRNVDEIDVIRNPHIASEHYIAKVINPQLKWYEYQDTGIVTSIWDSLALRLNSADYDGDHVCSISSYPLIAAVKRAKINTILWDRIDDPKDNKPLVPISDIKKVIETSVVGMQNRIGDVVNKISILWSLPQTDQIKDAIKIMSIIGSLTIDFAKSGEKAETPPDINALLKGKKKPEWMKYRHNRDIQSETVMQSNKALYFDDKDEIEAKLSFEYRKDCTMQQICDYMKSQIANIVEKFEEITDIVQKPELSNAYMLKFIKGNVYKNNVRYQRLLDRLVELQTDFKIINNEIFKDLNDSQEQKADNDLQFKIFFSYCRDQLMDACCNVSGNVDKKMDTLLDYLIFIYYSELQFVDCNRAILWNAFESEMITRCTTGNINENIDIERVQARLKNKKDKIDKIKQNKYQVYIKQFETKQDINISIPQGLIDGTKNIDDCYDRRLYLILWGLYNKNGCEPLKINSFSKNEINQSQICKLARFDKDARQYKKSIRNLINQGLVKIDKTKGIKSPAIIINNTFTQEEKSLETFNDINDYANYINGFS